MDPSVEVDWRSGMSSAALNTVTTGFGKTEKQWICRTWMVENDPARRDPIGEMVEYAMDARGFDKTRGCFLVRQLGGCLIVQPYPDDYADMHRHFDRWHGYDVTEREPTEATLHEVLDVEGVATGSLVDTDDQVG